MYFALYAVLITRISLLNINNPHTLFRNYGFYGGVTCMSNKEMDQATNQATESAKDVAKKTGNAAKNGMKKIGKKFGKKAKKAALKLGKQAIKIIGKLIAKLVAVGWPVLVVILFLVILIVFVDHFMIENRGASREYDFYSDAENEYYESVNDYGDAELMAVSEENAFLEIFYETEVDNAYWKLYKYDNEIVMDAAVGRTFGTYIPESKQPKQRHEKVKDKYGREDYFVLTGMNAYALDEYLNEFEAFTPQTFVQPVPFRVNMDTFKVELVPVTDDDGELSLESVEYYQHGEDGEGRPIYRKKYDEDGQLQYTKGVWDYGFAPTYMYEEFTEEYEARSFITGAQIWDIDDQKFRAMTTEELGEFKGDGKPKSYETYKGAHELGEGATEKDDSSADVPLVTQTRTEQSWLIRNAITPIGVIRNNIKQEWRQTNEETKETHTITMNVPIEYEKTEQKTDDDGNPLFYNVYYRARYIRDYVPLNRSGFHGGGIDYGGGLIGLPGYNPKPPSKPAPPKPKPKPKPTPSKPKDDGRGNKPIYEDPHQGLTRYDWGVVPDGFPELPKSPNESFTAPSGWKVDFKEVRGGGTTTTNTGDHNKIMHDVTYYELEPREHQVETTGYIWEYIPLYDGDPDLSGLVGLDYYTDYFTYYDNYVTKESTPEANVDNFIQSDINSDYFEDMPIDTPLDVLEYARMDELANLKRQDYDDPTGWSGYYDRPFTFEQRKAFITGDYSELEERHELSYPEEQPLMKAIRDYQVTSSLEPQRMGGMLDLSQVNFSKESSSKAVQNASEYYEYFDKYGAEFGVDPMLLLALAAHESNGRHLAYSGEAQSYGVRRSASDYAGRGYADSAAIGIMQVRPLHGGRQDKARDVTAFNHTTNSMERFSATAEELHDVETNIKFGAMVIASEIASADDDILVGLASYHYGGRFRTESKKNGFIGWSLEAESAYIGGGHAGTYGFVPNVLQYYLPTADSPTPWFTNKEGRKIHVVAEGVYLATEENTNIELIGSVTRRKRDKNTYVEDFKNYYGDIKRFPLTILTEVPAMVGKQFRSVDAITQFYGYRQTDDGKKDETDHYRVGTSLSGSQAEELLYTMLSYEEELYMHVYEDMTDEELVDRYLALFLKDIRADDKLSSAIDTKKFFPDGFQSPIENGKIVLEYGTEKDINGVLLDAPGATKIHAVADGHIAEIDKNNIVIDHGNEVSTIYSGMAVTINEDYKVGDEITRGTLIGMGSSGLFDSVSKNSIGFAVLNPIPTDPSWIVDPSLLSGGGGTLGIDPNATRFQHPYYGKDSKINSEYNLRRIHPITKIVTPHLGLDLAGTGSYRKTNTELGSIANGIVNQKGYDLKGWGHYVVIEHNELQREDGRKIFSLYAHMAEPSPLAVGNTVVAGDVIGREGTTGSSTGDHLHIEIIVGHGATGTAVRRQHKINNTVDPKPLLYY